MPPELKESKHHTIADWDFQSTSYRSLATDYYISAPTSLKFHGSSVGWFSAILCRIAGTLVLPQGEVRTWFRNHNAWPYIAVFRNQLLLGTANMDNCYYVVAFRTEAILYRRIAGTPREIGRVTISYSFDTWVHMRTAWYNGETPGGEDALCVDIYRDIAGEWVKQGATLYDTTNRWKDSARNRTGITSALAGGHLIWFDDTEIWGPV